MRSAHFSVPEIIFKCAVASDCSISGIKYMQYCDPCLPGEGKGGKDCYQHPATPTEWINIKVRYSPT